MAYRSIQPHHQVPAERTVHRHVQCIVTSQIYSFSYAGSRAKFKINSAVLYRTTAQYRIRDGQPWSFRAGEAANLINH
jgi:hypothetical protein